MTQPGGSELDALRDLLTGPIVDAAARDRAALDTRVTQLEAMLGDETAQRDLLARHLPAALEEARRTAPRKLSSALAPLVVKAIHREIANSRDSMIEALHPIMGRLVGVTVSNAIRALTAQINRRIEGALPIARLRLSVRAAIARKSVAELVISDLRAGELTRIMVIDRDAGVVLAAWEALTAQHAEDPDLVASMVSAIMQFAGSLGDEAGDLRTLSFQGRTLHIEASPAFLVVFQTNGALPEDAMTALQEAALEMAEAIGEGAEPPLEAQAQRLTRLSQQDAPETAGRWRLTAAGLLLAVAAAVPLWLARAETAALTRDMAAAREIAASHPALAGLPVEIRSVDGVLVLGAVARPGAALEGLDAALAERLAPRPVRLAVEIPVDPAALDAARAEIARLTAEMARLRARLGTAPGDD